MESGYSPVSTFTPAQPRRSLPQHDYYPYFPSQPTSPTYSPEIRPPYPYYNTPYIPPIQSRPIQLDQDDCNIPILYQARTLTLKTYLPLTKQFSNLSLRWVDSLLHLSEDLNAAPLPRPHQRRIIISAVGVNQSIVEDIKQSIREPLIWRECSDSYQLEQELELEDEKVKEWFENEEFVRREQKEQVDRELAEVEQVVHRGRRYQEENDEGNQSEELVIKQEESASPTYFSLDESTSHKRARVDEDEDDEEEQTRRAARKRLEYLAKLPRQSACESLTKHGKEVSQEAEDADKEALIGSRTEGIWHIDERPLGDIPPQIQVLMARAMRDARHPDSLKLYQHEDTTEKLKQVVPWFVDLLQLLENDIAKGRSST